MALWVLYWLGRMGDSKAPALRRKPRMKTCLMIGLAAACAGAAVAAGQDAAALPAFEPKADLLSLHYDHAPDKDDGQSAAADRTVLESLFGAAWLGGRVVAVSGAYGKNRRRFNPDSDAVMDAAWNDAGGWIAAHGAWDAAAAKLTARWLETLDAGGAVWVKEGGQSDLTAEAIKRVKVQRPDLDVKARVRVVQHSDWNEDQTTETALRYVKDAARYIRIRDANAYLNVKGGDAAFVEAAIGHPRFGPVWQAAFAYYPPSQRLDFSDTGELLAILGLGELGIEAFRARFLDGAEP